MRLEIRAGFAGFLILLCLLLDDALLAALSLAALCHELAHAVCIRALGGKILRLRLSFADLSLQTADLSYRQELVCLLAGPAANLLCFLLFRGRFPDFAAASALLGLYNLLPICPLDGGRMLLCALCLRMDPVRAGRLCRKTGLALGLSMFALSALLCVLNRLGPWPALAAASVCLRLLMTGGTFYLHFTPENDTIK